MSRLPRLAEASAVAPDDTVTRTEHERVREELAEEVGRLTQLLQGALRKQDEMALEAADAWQKVSWGEVGRERRSLRRTPEDTVSSLLNQAREHGAQREALQELASSREEQNQTLSSRLAESQDAVEQLKQLVDNHVASEREKNKRVRPRQRWGASGGEALIQALVPPLQIDDLSREVAKLKEALNSLSQLSFSAGSPSKRQQQLQQLDSLQTQVKQLQYQLAVRPAHRQHLHLLVPDG